MVKQLTRRIVAYRKALCKEAPDGLLRAYDFLRTYALLHNIAPHERLYGKLQSETERFYERRGQITDWPYNGRPNGGWRFADFSSPAPRRSTLFD